MPPIYTQQHHRAAGDSRAGHAIGPPASVGLSAIIVAQLAAVVPRTRQPAQMAQSAAVGANSLAKRHAAAAIEWGGRAACSARSRTSTARCKNGMMAGRFEQWASPVRVVTQSQSAPKLSGPVCGRRAGFPANREARTFGELSRQLGVDPLVLVNFLIDHRARLDGAVRGPWGLFCRSECFAQRSGLRQPAVPPTGRMKVASSSSPPRWTTMAAARSASARPCRCGRAHSPAISSVRAISFILNKVFTDVGVGSVTIQG